MPIIRFIELADSLAGEIDSDQLWDRAFRELRQFGFTSLCYVAMSSRKEIEISGVHSASIIKTNHPDAYLEAMGGENSFLENDISTVHVINEQTSLFWHQEPELEEYCDVQIHEWHLSNDMGMNVGLSVPTMMFSPSHFGGIGLNAGEHCANSFDQMWAEKQSEVKTILGVLDVGMRKNHLKTKLGLAPREVEVLKWLALGLRPYEIADRLKIGYRTVDKYINSAKLKLNAATRDQAVVKAIIFNVIEI